MAAQNGCRKLSRRFFAQDLRHRLAPVVEDLVELLLALLSEQFLAAKRGQQVDAAVDFFDQRDVTGQERGTRRAGQAAFRSGVPCASGVQPDVWDYPVD